MESDAYNKAVEASRQQEYPMIQDSIYLDHTGCTLPSRSLMDKFAHEITNSLLGNPHSASWASQQSTARIENIRLRLLDFFKADPKEFDIVFVANATAGVKLVVEAMRCLPEGFLFAHHQACHTSVIGAREEAKDCICLDNDDVSRWFEGESSFQHDPATASATLVAYSGQSHFDGTRYPLSWSHRLRTHCPQSLPRVYTLLDVASLAATSPIDLSDYESAPDFTVLSLYKIFGFPDLGALIVRRSAESVFSERRYFGGGTVDTVICGEENWHAPKSQFLHERLEDGTLPFHSIIAADIALDIHEQLYGSMDNVRNHTAGLSTELVNGLKQMRHGNGSNVCQLYTADDATAGHGPIATFNIRSSSGNCISLSEVDKLATLKKLHIRTGSLCSPGSIASALHLEPWEMKKNYFAGYRCGTDSDSILDKPTGVIRVSLGAMSTRSDVVAFLKFIQEYFVDSAQPVPFSEPLHKTASEDGELRVKTMTVYPIKSCGGFSVAAGLNWEVKPEGLAWDREWCLVHRGSGQALSQRRFPRMALLTPSLDFQKDVLQVKYEGGLQSPGKGSHSIQIPLSNSPSLFDNSTRQTPSRVCGEDITPYLYASPEINDFFSNVLDVPCVLTRFPPGGRGLRSRSSKAGAQSHQRRTTPRRLPGSFPDDVPSPPDSDTERKEGRILLANESPILMIHSASVDALNDEIRSRGGSTVDEVSFRANLVLEAVPGRKGFPAFAEDTWNSVRIGAEPFKLLGPCRRCQMVCVDQRSGEKKQEPYSTLAKTRRIEGKVFFGCHMCHDLLHGQDGVAQPRTVRVGDLVAVSTCV